MFPNTCKSPTKAWFLGGAFNIRGEGTINPWFFLCRWIWREANNFDPESRETVSKEWGVFLTTKNVTCDLSKAVESTTPLGDPVEIFHLQSSEIESFKANPCSRRNSRYWGYDKPKSSTNPLVKNPKISTSYKVRPVMFVGLQPPWILCNIYIYIHIFSPN